MSSGRITLYIATSVDGYVAEADGSVDWLEAFEPDGDEDVEEFAAFFESVDCLAMGATTYEQVLNFGDWPYDDKRTIVFTHRDLPAATEAVEFVDGDVSAVAADLERRYEHIWLVGGAQLARAFLRAGKVDALQLSLVPILLGDGIPLFAGEYGRWKLRLAETSRHESGIVEHRYEIAEADSRR